MYKVLYSFAKHYGAEFKKILRYIVNVKKLPRQKKVLTEKQTNMFLQQNKQCNALKVEEEWTKVNQPSNEWVSLAFTLLLHFSFAQFVC